MKRLLMIAVTLLLAPALFADELAAGAKAPGFSLTNVVDGKPVIFTPGDGKTTVVVFTCNQCPYARAFEKRIVDLGAEFTKRGIHFYAIDSNDDVAFPEETAAEMKSRAEAKHYPYPYLKDADSKIARAYGARVTPHVFVIDGTGTIRYRGYVDDSAKPEQRTHSGLKDALDQLTTGREINQPETKAFGCTIKYKRG